MLEEAAGIAGLHVRRKDAETKLRATEANLQRLDELLGDQEARVSALRRQARAAERYRALTDRIRLSEARLLYSRWAEAEAAARAATAEAEEAGRAVQALSTKLHEAESAQASAAALLADRRQAAVRARDEGQELAHRLATSRAALDTSRRRLADCARQAQQLEAERVREAALGEDAAQALAALEAEQAALADRLARAEEEQQRKLRAVAAAEEQAREAEAVLGSLLAREASLVAGLKVAEATRNAARSHALRLDEEAGRLAQQEAALGDGATLAERRRSAADALAAARESLAAAEKQIINAEEERGTARSSQEETEVALTEARSRHAAVASEARALEQAQEATAEEGVIALLSVEPGFEKALAAALGDDLSAPLGTDGGRGWGSSEPAAGDPQLPPGTPSLSCQVSAPPELARRLAQVGVVEEDDGRKLSAGQRLVTRDGGLRRWDGFVVRSSGAAAAQRLKQRNRLAALQAQLPELAAGLRSAEGAKVSATDRLEKAGRALEQARAALTATENRVRIAGREEDAAVAALDRHEEQKASLKQRQSELAPVRDAAARAYAEAEQQLAAVPQPGSLAGELSEARALAAARNAEVAELRADYATHARSITADRERQIASAREASAWQERAKAATRRLADAKEREAALVAEQAALAGEPDRLAALTSELEQQSQGASALVSAALAAEREAEDALATVGRALAQANEAVATAREARASAAARAEAQQARRIEYGRVCGEKFQCPPPLLPANFSFAPDELGEASSESALLERLTAERERLGPVNLVAEQELATLEEERSQGAADREDLSQAIHRLRGSIGNLNREGRVRLLEAYAAVDRHFQSLFTTLFEGGQAHLALTDSDDPLEAGLEIMAQPPGKRLSALSLLSGGEQALTAVALIFALFLTKPSPICVLDEVDAPLDDANVERFCDLLVRMTAETDTRYLIVTHNAVTMSRMHRLYGVTMVEKGVSRLVSVDLGGAEELLAAE
jgi:chromosome segregation protein